MLGGHLLPAFGAMRLDEITPLAVRDWHASYGGRTPSARAKAYRVLHAIMATAADDDELIAANPCRIRRGGKDPRQRRINVATEAEVAAVAAAVRPQWRMLVLLAAWCQLRFGELAELRRRDVDLDAGVLMITRAVSRTPGGLVGRPAQERGGHPRRHDPAVPARGSRRSPGGACRAGAGRAAVHRAGRGSALPVGDVARVQPGAHGGGAAGSAVS